MKTNQGYYLIKPEDRTDARRLDEDPNTDYLERAGSEML
jgi:parvulin-like peptidyl-prolyl isomerase